MRRIRKIFFIIALINIILIFNVKTYSTELGNELIVENNNIGDNTNSQEPENNVVETPPVEEPQEPIEPSNPVEPSEPEIDEPEPSEPENPEEPENSEQTTPENPEQTQQPEQPEQPDVPQEQEKPDSNITQKPDENEGNNNDDDKVVDTYNPIEEDEKSSNNNLKNLVVTDMEIEPLFEKDITEYYLIVDLTVEELEIKATAEDYKAKVNIYNNEELVEGENIIKIIVTAEDGTQKVYTIYVTKTDDAIAANANLKKINVKGFDLYPNFKNNIYKYNLTINEKVTSIDIEAEAENENAIVEVSGNKNLKEGNNIITITVIAEDGITKHEYRINTFISVFNVEVEEENKTPAVIAIIVGLVLIVTLAIYIMNNKHKNSV